MSRSDWSFIIGIVFLMFLFHGEPDLFDSIKHFLINYFNNRCV